MATQKPMCSPYVFWIAALFCCNLPIFGHPPTDRQTAESPEKELAVLGPLVGEWVAQPKDNEKLTKAFEEFAVGQTCKWILQKRFIEINSNSSVPGHPSAQTRTLITYDRSGACYRCWIFSSTGDVKTAHGKWDSETATLTWTIPDKDAKGSDSTTTMRFLDNDTTVWGQSESSRSEQVSLFISRLVLRRVNTPEADQQTK